MTKPLLDLFKAYPGGVKALSRDLSVSAKVLYNAAEGYHASAPTELLEDVAEAFSQTSRRVAGKAVTSSRLHSAWVEVKHARLAKQEV